MQQAKTIASPATRLRDQDELDEVMLVRCTVYRIWVSVF